MVAITRETEMAEATVFISPDWVIMNRLRRVAPEIKRAYLVENVEFFQEALDRAVMDEGTLLDVEIGVALENPEGIEEAIGRGVEVITWTVDDEGEASAALEIGISRVTTNEVDRLLAWRAGLN